MLRKALRRGYFEQGLLFALRDDVEVDLARADPRDALSKITAQTLILGGRADPLMKDADALAAAIKGARVDWVDGDHLTAVGDPRFTAALTDFFA